MTDYSLAFLLAVVLVAATLLLGRARPQVPNPVLAHNLSWAVALGMYSLHWIAYVDVSTLAWAVIGLGILAFNLGALVPITLRLGHLGPSSLSVTSMTWATWVLPALFLVGVVFYLRAVSSTLGLGSIVHGASSVRTFQGSDGFGVAFPLYGRLLFFLGPLVFVLYANPWLSGIRVSRLTRILVLGGSLLGLALALGRTLLLVLLVWQAAIVYLRPRQRVRGLRFRRAVLLGTMGFLTIFAFQVLAAVTGKTGAADTRIQPFVRGPLASAASTSLVTYSSGGIPALSELIASDTVEYAFGRATFGPVAKVVPGFDPPKQIAEFALVPFPHNAYTWLETYLRDFGPVGAIVLPFAMGVLVAHVCGHHFSSSESLLIAALLFGLCLWAPLVNHFPSTFTWEYVGILAFSRARQRNRMKARPATHIPEMIATPVA